MGPSFLRGSPPILLQDKFVQAKFLYEKLDYYSNNK